MPELIDAKGLGCGQPVILAKNALEIDDEVIVLVDDVPALENLKILGSNYGCKVDIIEEKANTFLVRLKKINDTE